ncbi:2860_t:CDS:2 [Paraglomus occultum]|uniref:2860_t:CDS:1 n=1 Tax=Paraglomus occultum TaxID=144539 RepID=A0A9N9BEX9_9GLOM|nr:2860_t:CDS:2 [Paraglomus occultum]
MSFSRAYNNDGSGSHNRELSSSSSTGASGSMKRFGKGKDVTREIALLDFNTLDISVLRRYKRIHRLKVNEPATKEQLVQAVSKHYAAMKPIENEVIATFIYAVHNKGKPTVKMKR